jgi:hypothetical protein
VHVVLFWSGRRESDAMQKGLHVDTVHHSKKLITSCPQR